jgi:hypothetical protein
MSAICGRKENRTLIAWVQTRCSPVELPSRELRRLDSNQQHAASKAAGLPLAYAPSAEMRGFEPRFTESESGVLPLDDIPMSTPSRTRTCVAAFRKRVPDPLGYGGIGLIEGNRIPIPWATTRCLEPLDDDQHKRKCLGSNQHPEG